MPPPYSLEQVYTALSAINAIAPTLAGLRENITADVVAPIVSGRWSVEADTTDSVSTLRLAKADSQQPKAILGSISTLLDSIPSKIFPALSVSLPARETFLAEINTAILEQVLEQVILSSMPAALSSVPSWLEIVHDALGVEEKHLVQGQRAVIKPFFETRAGEAWANQRRQRVDEDVRKLVIGGWGGWEAREAEREKDITMVVEVEVEPEPEGDVTLAGNGTAEGGEGDDSFGWGFDDEKDKKGSSTDVSMFTADDGAQPSAASNVAAEDDGWGFGEEETETTASAPEPAPAPPSDEPAEDGWDFDDPMGAPEPVAPAPPPPTAKPAREAKKLGKKVAKAAKVKSQAEEDDPWGSGIESPPRAPSPLPMAIEQPEQAAVGTSPQVQDDGWGWDEPESQTDQASAPVETTMAPPTPPKKKQSILEEQRRTIRETFLVSRSCDKLVEIADRVLKEISDSISAE